MTFIPAIVTGNVADPHWYWWIVFYFFFGGIAAGAYLIGAMSDLFSRREDGRENRAVARAAYLLALPLIALCGILLILDLGKPLRFWHMLVNVSTNQPAFKYWSPISYGSWVLTGFGLCVALSAVLAFAELRGITLLGAHRLGTGLLGKVIAAIGAVFALFFGSYTGVLLNHTNQRVWGDNTLLGALFMASAVASGAAALLLILSLARRRDGAVLERLERTDVIATVVELVLLFALLAVLAAVGRAGALAGGVLGVLLWLGVVLLGLLVPLGLNLRPRTLGARTPLVAATLALIGVFLLRYVVIFSAHA
ncbi:MAG: polysulfide reductase NrfD [Chloroflexota bacterium]|nr:polysulfide reductase NrfD [Chloroflexota bacterium]